MAFAVPPHNVLVSFEGEVKLTDFGIARVPGSGSLTGPGMLKGKLGYMAPEQASDDPVDARADLFALGVVLWEMCTGQRLFARDTDVATLRALTGSDPVPPPSFWNEGVPPALDAIVMGLLERDPSRRTATADEVAARLAEVELAVSRTPEERDLRPLMRRLWPGDIPFRPTPSPPPPEDDAAPLPAEATTATWPERRPARSLGFLAVGLLLAMTVGAAWWVGTRRAEPPARPPVVGTAPPGPAPSVPPPAAPVQAAPAEERVAVAPSDPLPVARVAPATTADPAGRGGEGKRSPAPRPSAPPAGRPGVLASADALEGLELPPASSGEGLLFVNALPWAEIQLDGQVEGITPRELRLAAGRHRLRLVHPTRGAVEREADVRAGERLRVEIPLNP